MRLKKHKNLISLLLAMTLFFVHPVWADRQKGEALYMQNCLSCHAASPPVKVSIEEIRSRKGMPLWFVGSKFKQEWLEPWLVSPQPIFAVKWGTLTKGANDHPAVAVSDIADLVSYLMTLVDSEIKTDTTPPLPKSRGKRKSMLGKTRQLFEKHQGCYACHQYLNKRQKTLGGFSGPSMVAAAKSLNPDWVYAYLKNPRRYYPNGTCPIPGESAFNKFTDKNRADLATYISNMGVK